MTGTWWLAADPDNIGRVSATTLACVCGDTHTIKTRGIQNPAIPSLVTSIVDSLDEWRTQRDWCRTHRPHGGIQQQESPEWPPSLPDTTRSALPSPALAIARYAANESADPAPSPRPCPRSTATPTAQSAPAHK